MSVQGFRSYFFPLILILFIMLGAGIGRYQPTLAHQLKPVGDLFLNIILIIIFPLIFFSVSAAIVRVGSLKKLSKIAFYMFFVFLFTGMIAALSSIVVVKIFPPAQGMLLPTFKAATMFSPLQPSSQVDEWLRWLNQVKILLAIFFSVMVGLVLLALHKKKMIAYLHIGEDVCMRVFSFVMYGAPIGFCCYFAVLVSDLGTSFMTGYIRIAYIYYVFSLFYFIFVYTSYAYLAKRTKGVTLFWKHIFIPMITSIATCSSAASIPANLNAAKQMQIPAEIYETTIPLGTILHKEGSIIGGIIKISFLFGIFHLDFSGLFVLLIALGVSLLVGTVMGAIPSGGMLGELLILSVYGFPMSALMAIAAISIIIDPPATLLNVTGNSISSMLIAKWCRYSRDPS